MTDRAIPGERAPELKLPQSGESSDWDLQSANPESFTLMVFYRGIHCPICRKQLEELSKRAEEFRSRGVDVVAISCDDELKAAKARNEWDIDNLPILYDLNLDQAQEWGLYVSQSIKNEEPTYFSEPGMFLIDPEGAIYAVWVQSVPFARPTLLEILNAVDFVRDNEYPPRGVISSEQLRATG